MGSSGGTTNVIMITTWRINLKQLRVGSSHPWFNTTTELNTAHSKRMMMNRKVSLVFTPSLWALVDVWTIVLSREPCCVSNPVRRTIVIHPSSGGDGMLRGRDDDDNDDNDDDFIFEPTTTSSSSSSSFMDLDE
mmetsp:Transcript_20371/g.30605  ORF Transcript_20371/g.30605 Transcript_20371/m.30605 type:complete len:134 (-) Transcript_20371:195-596(-)